MPCVSWERIMSSYLKIFSECFVLPIILRTFASEASRADTRKSGLANRAITLSHGGQYDVEVIFSLQKQKRYAAKHLLH